MVAKPTFEKALTDLEKILQELESGDLPLEKAIKKFEQGMALSKFCEKTILQSIPTGIKMVLLLWKWKICQVSLMNI